MILFNNNIIAEKNKEDGGGDVTVYGMNARLLQTYNLVSITDLALPTLNTNILGLIIEIEEFTYTNDVDNFLIFVGAVKDFGSMTDYGLYALTALDPGEKVTLFLPRTMSHGAGGMTVYVPDLTARQYDSVTFSQIRITQTGGTFPLGVWRGGASNINLKINVYEVGMS